MDVQLCGVSCKYFCVRVCVSMPQGDNVTRFGRHNNEISARGKEIKINLTVSACE
jgi:hypothetical protein